MAVIRVVDAHAAGLSRPLVSRATERPVELLDVLRGVTRPVRVLVHVNEDVRVVLLVRPWLDDHAMCPRALICLSGNEVTEDAVTTKCPVDGLDPLVELVEAALRQVDRVPQERVEVLRMLHRHQSFGSVIAGVGMYAPSTSS